MFPEFKGKPFTISNGTGGASAVLSGARLEKHNDRYGPWAYPLTVTDGMTDPVGSGCCWQLVYAGSTTSYGSPLFWIVKYDPDTAEAVSQLRQPHRSQPVLKFATDKHLGCRFTDQVFSQPIPKPGKESNDNANFWTVINREENGPTKYKLTPLAIAGSLLIPSVSGGKGSFTIGPVVDCRVVEEK